MNVEYLLKRLARGEKLPFQSSHTRSIETLVQAAKARGMVVKTTVGEPVEFLVSVGPQLRPQMVRSRTDRWVTVEVVREADLFAGER